MLQQTMYCSGCSCNNCMLKRESDQTRLVALQLHSRLTAIEGLLDKEDPSNSEMVKNLHEACTSLKSHLAVVVDKLQRT